MDASFSCARSIEFYAVELQIQVNDFDSHLNLAASLS